MTTVRRTMAQALVDFLRAQRVERDGQEQAFFAGCFGIFGHGNVAGVGEALRRRPDFRFVPCRNEQAMVHTAAAFAKASRRLRTYACTSSIGPGATNMITAAAGATINRLPVLLLPGDIFGRRNVAPVLQQLESERAQDLSVNDCLRPVSRYWDRIYRPDQLAATLPAAMRVLVSPAETGTVTLCLPEDVQTEAWDYPVELFEPRCWSVPRPRADERALAQAAEWIRSARSPLIVAGGGVHYSDATQALTAFATATGIAVAETQAGKGALNSAHPQAVGAIGVTGTLAANRLAREADLVIGLGTRYSDFTTASKTAFQHPQVRFVNVNVADFDAHKQGALPVVGDARVTLVALQQALSGHRVGDSYRARVSELARAWKAEVERIYAVRHGPPLSQGEVIGALEAASEPTDVVVCAAGSLPGDLHKLWRTRDSRGYHLEYGYSCMGYEIAGGLGVKLAEPEREVFVLCGDGSYLMMAQEIVTSVQEGEKLIVVVLDNHGYASIGALSESVGSRGFGTEARQRTSEGQLAGPHLQVDFAANAASLGAVALAVTTHDELAAAIARARRETRTTVIVVETDREARVGGYESWWDVPVAEVSDDPEVRAARERFQEAVRLERLFL